MGARQFHNWLRTLGAPEDPVATDTTSEWSLVSLMKALYLKITDGSFAATVTGRAESLVGLCQAAASQSAHYYRLCRARAAAALVSETNSAVSASAASAASGISVDASNFTSGNAMLGQRVKKDRKAAAASATAAAASAASITPESLVLGVQVYS